MKEQKSESSGNRKRGKTDREIRNSGNYQYGELIINIVDQIFIGQGVGLLGNAATNITIPIWIICTATALLFLESEVRRF